SLDFHNACSEFIDANPGAAQRVDKFPAPEVIDSLAKTPPMLESVVFPLLERTGSGGSRRPSSMSSGRVERLFGEFVQARSNSSQRDANLNENNVAADSDAEGNRKPCFVLKIEKGFKSISTIEANNTAHNEIPET